jgi:hypothetical protein
MKIEPENKEYSSDTLKMAALKKKTCILEMISLRWTDWFDSEQQVVPVSGDSQHPLY